MSETRRNVAVIGAGKMGLPVAVHMARRGFHVVACDINEALVAEINAGRCPIAEPGVADALAEAVASGSLRATTLLPEAVADADAVIVLVPVLLTWPTASGGRRASSPRANLSAIQQVVSDSVPHLKNGAILSIETTLPVGTTRALVDEALDVTGRMPGIDYHCVFSPERVKSLHVLERLDKTPKIVGGYSPTCCERAEEFYAKALGAPVIALESLEAAEFAKLADMIHRDANIALANELAEYAERIGVNFGPVREAANTSGESAILLPGVGVGGHCTPVYPWFAINDAEERGGDLALARAARETNERQPLRLLNRVEESLGSLSGRCVLILGFGFRPGVKEHINTPARALQRELLKRGARVRVHDPLYSEDELSLFEAMPHANWRDGWAEVLVLNTAHQEYLAPDYAALASAGTLLLADGRDAWDPVAAEAAGLDYIGVGRPIVRSKASR